jgi:putative alpha-1,2-mannosidase
MARCRTKIYKFICRPFYDKVTIDLPGVPDPLVISARGAPTNVYVKSLMINGEEVREPVIRHEQIAKGGDVMFEMSATQQAWANEVGIMVSPPCVNGYCLEEGT